MIVQICLLIVWKNFNQKASQIHYLKRREVGCCVNSFRGVKPQFIHFISNCCFVISFEKIFLIFIVNRKLISSLEERFHSSGISFKQKVCFTVWKSCIVDCFGISSIYFKQKVCSIIVLVLFFHQRIALQKPFLSTLPRFKKFKWKWNNLCHELACINVQM